MNSVQVIEQVKRILVEDLDVNLKYEDLNDPAIPLFEGGLGLDSVVLVELIGFIERSFHIQLSDDALNVETWKTLSSVAELVGDQMALQPAG